jgi:hypothetical protein
LALEADRGIKPPRLLHDAPEDAGDTLIADRCEHWPLDLINALRGVCPSPDLMKLTFHQMQHPPKDMQIPSKKQVKEELGLPDEHFDLRTELPTAAESAQRGAFLVKIGEIFGVPAWLWKTLGGTVVASSS